MDSLNPTPHGSTLALKLSVGNKRKLSLATALMGTPRVLIPDEPTYIHSTISHGRRGQGSFWKAIETISTIAQCSQWHVCAELSNSLSLMAGLHFLGPPLFNIPEPRKKKKKRGWENFKE